MVSPDDSIAPGGRERIWEHSIVPLLEEHYYGRLTRQQVHDRFGLTAIRAKALLQSPPVHIGRYRRSPAFFARVVKEAGCVAGSVLYVGTTWTTTSRQPSAPV